MLSAIVQAQELSIEGRVLDEGGQPFVGAVVSLLPVLPLSDLAALEDQGLLTPKPVASTKSDPEGYFQLVAPEAGSWRMLIEAAGRAAVEGMLSVLVDPIVLEPARLEPDRQVDLEVLGAEGNPLAGAKVAVVIAAKFEENPRMIPMAAFGSGFWNISPSRTLTDATGRARVSRQRAASDLWLVAPGHAPLRVPLGDEQRQKIQLIAGRKLGIVVRDPSGRPAAGALVKHADLPFLVGRTDAEGRATIDVAGSESKKHQVISGLDFFEGRPPAAGSPAAETWRIALAAPPEYSGKVVDTSAKKSIANARIWTLGQDPKLLRSAADGSFLARTRSHMVFVEAAGYQTAIQPLLPETTVALEPAASLGGEVTDGGGRSVAEVELKVKPLTGDENRLRSFIGPEIRRFSNRHGQFLLPRIEVGAPLELRGLKSGFGATKLKLESFQPFESRRNLKLVLDAGRKAFGLVLDLTDQPIAGAQVELIEAPTDGSFRPSPAFRGVDLFVPAGLKTTTDALGKFELAGVTPGVFDLEVSAVSFAPATIVGLMVRAGAGPEDLGTVKLAPGSAIEGRVFEVGAGPIADAEIRVVVRPGLMSAYMLESMAHNLRVAATTSADGFFAVRDLQPRDPVHLIVSHPKYSNLVLPNLPVPTSEPVRVEMVPSSRLSGRVLDQDGQPIEAALVSAGPEGGQRRSGAAVRTDSEGRFALAGVKPGMVVLMVGAAGFQSVRRGGLDLAAGQEIADLEIRLDPGAVVEGRVRQVDGEPAKERWVSIGGQGGGMTSESGMTDGSGSYRIENARPGPAVIRVQGSNGSTELSKNIEIKPGSQQVDLVLEPGVTVQGRVVDEAGAPIAEATVSLGFRVSVSTKEDGTFQVTSVRPGSHQLSVRHTDFAEGVPDQLEVGTEPIAGLEIVLRKGALVKGRLLGLSPEDFGRVDIMIRAHSGKVAARTTTMSPGRPRFDGTYSIDNVAPGDYFVTGRLPAAQAQAVVSVPHGAVEIEQDLDFAAGYRLSGQIRRDGQPLRGLRVWVFSVGLGATVGTETDAAGKFQLGNLPAGTYDLTMRDIDTGFSTQRQVVIEHDTELEIELESSRLGGRVLDSERNPVATATVLLEGENNPSATGRMIRTDSFGRFFFDNVLPGRVTLRARKNPFVDAVMALEPAAGEDRQDLELVLQPGQSLKLEIRGGAGAVPDHLEGCFFSASGELVTCDGWSPIEGKFEITSLAAGAYLMLVADHEAPARELRVAVPGEAGPLVLARGGLVKLEVPDLTSGATPAKARFLGADGRPYRDIAWRRPQEEWPLSRGSLTLRLPAGSWTVQVNAEGRTFSQVVQVTEGGENAVELR